MKIFAQLEKAQLENTTSDTGSLPKGMITYRTDLNIAKVSNGTSMLALIDESSTQTLSGKTYATPNFTGAFNMAQAATPSNPSSGNNKFYFKADGKLYTLDSSGNEALVGSGSGGVKNLITNGSADDTAASIFTAYADAVATRPISGTGGSPTVTTSITTTTPLDGTKAFLLTKTAANSQGQGWSVPFTVDPAYRAKSLKISVDYIVNSGTFVAGGAGVESDVIWYIYDVTNSQLIEPSNIKMFSNNSSLSDKFEATFQSSATGSSYRLIAHVQSVSALAYELKVDNITVSPQTYVYGSPITDWTSYTPTFNGSPTTASVTFWSRRVGDSLQIIGSFQLTSVNASTTAITMPSGLSIDTTKVGTTKRFVFGEAARIVQTASETTLVKHVVAYNTSFTDQLFLASTSLSQNLGVNAWNGLFVNNDWVTVDALVPISGWSSSVQMSDSADTRIVDCVVTTTANITGTAGSAFVFPVVTKDSHGAYNSSTGVYTVPVAGDYQIHGTGLYSSAGDTACNVQINGSFNNNLTTTDNTRCKSGSMLIPNLKAGDTIKIVPDVSRNLIYSAGNYIPTLSIVRISGPSAIAANETVAAIYEMTANQSIPNTTETTITWDTKVRDTHGTMNASGIFTVPVAGIYTVSSTVGYTNNSTGLRYMVLSQTGSATKDYRAMENNSPGTGAFVMCATVGFNCRAGDTLFVRTYQSSGGALTLNGPNQNVVTIKRIGG